MTEKNRTDYNILIDDFLKACRGIQAERDEIVRLLKREMNKTEFAE